MRVINVRRLGDDHVVSVRYWRIRRDREKLYRAIRRARAATAGGR